MSAPTAGLRVLAIAEDVSGLVTACRVHAPLHTLRRLGSVSDYVVTDSTLRHVPRDFAFDVLWVQRAPDPHLSSRIAERLPGGYLHDMDDLLVTVPEYVRAREFPPREPLVRLLKESAVLTAPTERLVRLTEEHAGISLEGQSLICPNAIEFPRQPARRPEPPQGLLLTQSHRLALTDSREAVIGSLREFASREHLPLYFFGPPPEVLGSGVEALLGPIVPCGYLDFWRYHAVLAASPSLLAVAPLETKGDQATLDFVSAKSDVKMVEYGGFGHPGVYSDAPPYADSDLGAGVLAANDRAAWDEALGTMLEDGWRRAAEEQSRVVAARSLERIAAECWEGALKRACLPEPLTVGALSVSRPRRRRLLGRFLQ